MKPTGMIIDPLDGQEYRIVGEVRMEQGVVIINHCSLRIVYNRKTSEPVLSERKKQQIYSRCVAQLILIAGAQAKDRENVARDGKLDRIRDIRRRRLYHQ